MWFLKGGIWELWKCIHYPLPQILTVVTNSNPYAMSITGVAQVQLLSHASLQNTLQRQQFAIINKIITLTSLQESKNLASLLIILFRSCVFSFFGVFTDKDSSPDSEVSSKSMSSYKSWKHVRHIITWWQKYNRNQKDYRNGEKYI